MKSEGIILYMPQIIQIFGDGDELHLRRIKEFNVAIELWEILLIDSFLNTEEVVVVMELAVVLVTDLGDIEILLTLNLLEEY
jgi:hypothetical protein